MGSKVCVWCGEKISKKAWEKTIISLKYRTPSNWSQVKYCDPDCKMEANRSRRERHKS